jgi:hypothetical protein
MGVSMLVVVPVFVLMVVIMIMVMLSSLVGGNRALLCGVPEVGIIDRLSAPRGQQ